jgi:hypothetical protein
MPKEAMNTGFVEKAVAIDDLLREVEVRCRAAC